MASFLKKIFSNSNILTDEEIKKREMDLEIRRISLEASKNIRDIRLGSDRTKQNPPKTKHCKYFHSIGGCKKDNCTFLHISQSSQQQKSQKCNHYLKSGCMKGPECKFSHN